MRADPTHVYDTVVDATTGETLYRVNLVREATARAFDNYPGAPIGGAQVDKVFSETGADPWLTAADRLAGDNAHVYADPNDAIDGFPPADPSPQPADEIPPSAPGAWNYAQDARAATSGQLCPSAGCTWNRFGAGFSWTVNQAQAATQLFYFVNTYHDHLRDAPGIGFDDSSNNFEGADRVEAQVDDGAATALGQPACDHANNAFVIPVPDGTALVMQLYLWSSYCFPGPPLTDVNPADDALIVYHEYTHGMTNRLVTDASGFPALNGQQPEAMDEGFADWYAVDMLNAQGLEPDSAAPGELVAGRYEHDALRTQAFDCPVGASAPACPGTPTAGPGGYTYGDFGHVVGSAEPHADGEIWVETLWDLRAGLIADHGAGEGVNRARALITDGLRLAPANPSFLDMRNAILQADLNRGFGDSGRIWAVFAERGMGFLATTTGNRDTTPAQDFSVPPASQPQRLAPDRTRPAIRRLGMSRRRLKVGQGTIFTFRLSEAASIAIVIDRSEKGRRVGRRCRAPKRSLRHRPRCTRHVKVGSLARSHLSPGPQRVTFRGRAEVAPPACRALPGVDRGHRRRGQPLPHAAPDASASSAAEARRGGLAHRRGPGPPRSRGDRDRRGLAHLRPAARAGRAAGARPRRSRGARGRPRAGHPSARAGLRRAAARAAAPGRRARARARPPSRRCPRRASPPRRACGRASSPRPSTP